MTELQPANRARQLIAGTRRLNQHPLLVGALKGVRERALGEAEYGDLIARSRSGPAALMNDAPGVLGELGSPPCRRGSTWRSARAAGHGEIDVAILFTDLAGFSDWALAAGDGPAIELLRAISKAIEPPILERRGEVVKRLDDGLMAAFPDASSAVEAAFAARERAARIEVAGVPADAPNRHSPRPPAEAR